MGNPAGPGPRRRPARPNRPRRPAPAPGEPDAVALPATTSADPEAAPAAPSSKSQRPRGASRPKRTPPRSRPARLAETAGPEPDTPLADVRLSIGTIVGVHGIQGELKLRLATDDPDHLPQIKRVYVGDEPTPRRVLGVRFHRGGALVRLAGITTPEAGDALRGAPVRIAGADARPPAPGEFFLYQIVGLEAVDETGASLGRVTDVLETGAHDVFVVTPADGAPDLLLPNHPDVVLDIRPNDGRMVVRPLIYDD